VVSLVRTLVEGSLLLVNGVFLFRWSDILQQLLDNTTIPITISIFLHYPWKELIESSVVLQKDNFTKTPETHIRIVLTPHPTRHLHGLLHPLSSAENNHRNWSVRRQLVPNISNCDRLKIRIEPRIRIIFTYCNGTYT